jgi:hypothetical protein
MMSRSSRSAATAAQPAQRREDGPESSASRGVEVAIKGWRPGLNKVRLTQALRDGGLGLQKASKLTGAVLDGQEIRVRLEQFETVAAARSALMAIGVETVAAIGS